MKNIKRIFIIFILFLTYILFSIFCYASTVSSDISNSVFRLHVIANSNSKKDQDLKYAVRDELIAYMKSISKNVSTKEDAIKIASEHKKEFYDIAKNVVEQNGFNYDVSIEIGNFSFPTKTYGDITLPSGFYDALRVKIGEASGKNWWCVMFPSLCFVDVTNGIVPEESKENLHVNLEEEDYNLISSDKLEYKVKFKLVELFENAKIIMAKK